MIQVTEIQIYDNSTGGLIKRESVLYDFPDKEAMEQNRIDRRREINRGAETGHRKTVYFTYKEIPLSKQCITNPPTHEH